MQYSLWAGDKYLQSSDSVRVLKCNTNQLKAWCVAMSVDNIPEHLTIKDNNSADTKTVFQARYKFGGQLNWKAVTYDTSVGSNSSANVEPQPRFHRAPRPTIQKVYTQ